MASRKSPQEPTAAIVVKAESNEQLSNILLALAQAVEREQHPHTAHHHPRDRQHR
jgi:hypothetical protein